MPVFKYKAEKGILNIRYICECPVCKRSVEIPTSNTVSVKGGYKIKTTISCSCGYASNIIVKNPNKFPKNVSFQRTCKDCKKVWRFNYNDLLTESTKATRNLAKSVFGIGGSAIGLLPQERVNEPCRCAECGSRKVRIEVE